MNIPKVVLDVKKENPKKTQLNRFKSREEKIALEILLDKKSNKIHEWN